MRTGLLDLACVHLKSEYFSDNSIVFYCWNTANSIIMRTNISTTKDFSRFFCFKNCLSTIDSSNYSARNIYFQTYRFSVSKYTPCLSRWQPHSSIYTWIKTTAVSLITGSRMMSKDSHSSAFSNTSSATLRKIDVLELAMVELHCGISALVHTGCVTRAPRSLCLPSFAQPGHRL